MNPLVALYSGLVRTRNQLYDRGTLKVHRLEGPVVSIGNIAVGGSGKTPFLIALGELLKQRGIAFDVLSRGYGRATKGVHLVEPEGSPREFGDEPLLIARKLNVPVIVGEDRYAAGRFAEQKFGPQIHLLDDGFQHRRLERDLDIVLLDALNPLAGGAVFPLGRLREPVSAVSRAGALIIMRAAWERQYSGLRQLLASHNPRAPIFRARTQPRYWVSHRTARLAHPPEGPVAAFCGLANPASFWGTLREQRIRPVFTWAFSDHHRYNWDELHGLAAQARLHGSNVLLCTEKDAMNLPERSMELLLNDSVELFWLKVGVQIEEEDALLELIESTLRG